MKEVYVTPMLGYTFMVPKVNEKGEPVRKTKEGNILYPGDTGYAFGLPIEERMQFTTTERDINKGYQSRYAVDENTPKEVADKLAELAANRSTSVVTLKEWTKMTEPKRAEAEEKAETLLSENEALKSKMAKMAEEMEKIRKSKGA